MTDYKETAIGYLNVDDHATFSSGEVKWIRKILAFKEQYPDEVDIKKMPENNCGVIFAHVPKSWLKVSPPRKVNLSEEQKAAAAERMASARKKRKG